MLIKIKTLCILVILCFSFISCFSDEKEDDGADFLPYTLSYDDNSSEIGIYPWMDIVGVEVAVKFTPTDYPTKITKARFYVTDQCHYSTEFAVKIYSIDPDTNGPGTSLLNIQVTAQATTGNEWVEVNLEKYNIRIADGDFFIAMEWLTSPGTDNWSESLGPNDALAQLIGCDTSTPMGRSWINFHESHVTWHEYKESLGTAPDDGNFMIRVDLE